tara:strand:+ start:3502 stop:3783 length:282 start_codon:yes stop_codon:yes gene_type:complete
MIAEAILKIKSDAQVSVVGNDLDTCTITWHDGNPTDITKEQIKAKINEFGYQEERKKEYPSHEDCIHALLDGGDTLTELQEKRQATKTKYPKP